MIQVFGGFVNIGSLTQTEYHTAHFLSLINEGFSVVFSTIFQEDSIAQNTISKMMEFLKRFGLFFKIAKVLPKYAKKIILRA